MGIEPIWPMRYESVRCVAEKQKRLTLLPAVFWWFLVIFGFLLHWIRQTQLVLRTSFVWPKNVLTKTVVWQIFTFRSCINHVEVWTSIVYTQIKIYLKFTFTLFLCHSNAYCIWFIGLSDAIFLNLSYSIKTFYKFSTSKYFVHYFMCFRQHLKFEWL